MNAYNSVVSFFQDGGVFLYPIGLVFAIGIAIAIERWIYLNFERRRNIKSFEGFLPMLRTSNIKSMESYVRDDRSPVMRVIASGLDMIQVSRERTIIEQSMNEGMLEVLPRLQQRTGYLSMLANVATLLGLLGTIIGLISAFDAVANVDPAEKSKMLSEAISVAMNTTAFGLIAAIPLLILHSVLQTRTGKIVSSIEMSAVKFLNLMTLNKKLLSGSQAPIDSSDEDGSDTETSMSHLNGSFMEEGDISIRSSNSPNTGASM